MAERVMQGAASVIQLSNSGPVLSLPRRGRVAAESGRVGAIINFEATLRGWRRKPHPGSHLKMLAALP
jgi:hypothetical protein